MIPAKDGCPVRFRPLRDDYVASCRARGNAEATLVAKDKAASRFLGYLDETGTGLAWASACGTCRASSLRQRGAAGQDHRGHEVGPGGLPGLPGCCGPRAGVRPGRLLPPATWQSSCATRVRAAPGVDRGGRSSAAAGRDRPPGPAVGKRDYAMPILLTARLGLRISDLRQLELGDLGWRAKTLTIVQRQDGLTAEPAAAGRCRLGGHRPRPARPPWRPACAKVFVKQPLPSFGPFGCSLVGRHLGCRTTRPGRRPAPGVARPAGCIPCAGLLAVGMIGNGAPMPVHSRPCSGTPSDRYDPGLLPALRTPDGIADAVQRWTSKRRPRPAAGAGEHGA